MGPQVIKRGSAFFGYSGFYTYSFCLIFIYIEVQLIYNVLLVSGKHQSDLVIYIHTHIYTCIYMYINLYLLFFKFFSYSYYYRILNTGPMVYSRFLLVIYFKYLFLTGPHLV